jgi:hypothetical protein
MGSIRGIAMGNFVRAVAYAAVLLGAVALTVPSGSAHASGQRWSGPYLIYGIDIPDGWTKLESKGSKVAFESADHRGQIFIGVSPATGSLKQELEKMVRDDVSVEDRRFLSIRGVPCYAARSVSQRGVWANELVCEFTFPFDDGTRQITYYMGSVSGRTDYTAHTEIFWDMVDTLIWNASVSLPDDGEDEEDQ